MTAPRTDLPDTKLHPPIEPYETGFLTVGDEAKHELYYELSGNPDGLPALFLHGGPGGGTRPGVRQFFNPAKYRIVLLDQRGAGQSRPNVADNFTQALADNTTEHLVADLEVLREHLGVTIWHLVLGGSWGSTLALAYAQAHPDRMKNLLLRGIFTFLRDEVDNLFRNGLTALHYPDVWEAYRDFVVTHPTMAGNAPDDLLEGYRLLLENPDTREAAAAAFVAYELALSSAISNPERIATTLSTPSTLIPFASLEVVYMLADGFMQEGQLLQPERLARLGSIQVSTVHGRADHVCLPTAAWRLHKALLSQGVASRLWFIDGNGHSDAEPGIGGALRMEADRIA
ncbi:MAG: alpha/beta fold hydrolase [Gammaproteobacteria bacterium]